MQFISVKARNGIYQKHEKALCFESLNSYFQYFYSLTLNTTQSSFMKNQLLVLLATFIFYASPAISQVSDDDEAMAYRLKKKYPDERTACVSDIEEYDFEVSKGDGNGPVIAAIMNQKIQFISLREAAMVQYGEYYDKFSSINKFKQYYKAGLPFPYNHHIYFCKHPVPFAERTQHIHLQKRCSGYCPVPNKILISLYQYLLVFL